MQTIGARFAQQQITLEYAAEVGCRACASPGGGCQFLGTAATSQVVGEALGLVAAAYCAGSFRTADLARCGETLCTCNDAVASSRSWAHAISLTHAAVRNAMVLHAAFGGSTNLLLHLPAIAFSAGLERPRRTDWAAS